MKSGTWPVCSSTGTRYLCRPSVSFISYCRSMTWISDVVFYTASTKQPWELLYPWAWIQDGFSLSSPALLSVPRLEHSVESRIVHQISTVHRLVVGSVFWCFEFVTSSKKAWERLPTESIYGEPQLRQVGQVSKDLQNAALEKGQEPTDCIIR